MSTRNRHFTVIVAALVVAVLALLLAGTAVAAPTSGKLTVAAGDTYVIDKITKLSYLKIAEGGTLKAAPGYSITMTVNGLETGGMVHVFDTGVVNPPMPPFDPGGPVLGGECWIKPGVYRGDIVLTPTIEMLLDRGAPFPAGNEPAKWPYRTALYIDKGVVAERSVLSGVKGGKVTSTSAKDLRLTSTGDYFTGVMVMGDSRFTLWNPRIDFTGNGHDDFGGYAFGIRVGGTSNVTVNKGNITTNGVVRGAVWVGNEATVTVNNTTINTGNGVLPADWLGGPFPPGTGGSMLTVPWMLGISGNCRATLVNGSGHAYYNNCSITALEWGAMSTDMCRGASLTVTNSKIKVIKSGYGAYSDQQVDDTFIHTTFDVPDYGVIMTGPGTTTFTEASVVNSGRWAMMFHGGAPGTVVIDKGTTFNSGLTSFLMKNAYPTINADNAHFNPGNGIILHAMLSDDPMSPDASGGDHDIDANFSNMAMTGDIANTNTTKCNVNVTLTNASIAGVISTGTQEFLGTYPRTPEDREDIGMVKVTYAATSDTYGAKVTINAGGVWNATKTSYITSLRVNTGGTLNGKVTVNGAATTIVPGQLYTGAIVVTAN